MACGTYIIKLPDNLGSETSSHVLGSMSTLMAVHYPSILQNSSNRGSTPTPYQNPLKADTLYRNVFSNGYHMKCSFDAGMSALDLIAQSRNTQILA